jgi:hypothetical protein
MVNYLRVKKTILFDNIQERHIEQKSLSTNTQSGYDIIIKSNEDDLPIVALPSSENQLQIDLE